MSGRQKTTSMLGLSSMLLVSIVSACDQNNITVGNCSLTSLDCPNCTDNIHMPEQEITNDYNYNNFPFISKAVIRPIIAVPGIVCNAINIYVLFKQGTNSSTTRYLIGLGIFDLLYLVFIMCTWAQYILYNFYRNYYIDMLTALHYSWLSRFWGIVFGRISNLLVVLMSLERFVAVRFPLLVKSFPLSRHSFKVILCVAICVSGLMVPNLIGYEYINTFDKQTNVTVIGYRRTEFGATHREFYKNYTYAILTILRLMPILSVVALNTGIIITLKMPGKLKVSLQTIDKKREVRQRKITRMLLAVSVMFVLLVSPGMMASFMSNFLSGYNPRGKYREIWVWTTECTTVMDLMNSAGNFFIYIIMSERFRDIFLTTFCNKNQKANKLEKGPVAEAKATDSTDQKI